ncbi:alpha/beta hydrolase [soil metagenome]
MTRLPARATAAALAVAALLGLAACGPTGSDSSRVEPTAPAAYPESTSYPDIPVVPDIRYGTADGAPLLLDACLPAESDGGEEPRAAIVVIHGGSWQHGDKANLNWRSVCQWFASEGFVAVSVNYRLVPAATFPAQLDDVQAAVRWLREPAQVEEYNLDPERIGAFGGSAGGSLAALLGTVGSGPWTEDARVAAVAELSGPVDLRTRIDTTDSYNQDFGQVVLDYLGCTAFADCPGAAKASPVFLVDETDPPFFVAHSTEEFIPIAQSDEFVEALRGAGIDTDYVTVKGSLHSIAMLDDDIRSRIIAFFRDALGRDAVEPSPEPGE